RGLGNSLKAHGWHSVGSGGNSMKRFTLIGAVVAILGAVAFTTQPASFACGQQAKDIDVVICLDVSGSMQGLVAQSKNKLWHIVEQKWSTQKNSLKLIFVAGNEPASQDPTIKLKEVADLAKKHDVIINPIYCGNADDSDARDWRELATFAGGRFANINHNQHVVVNTPMDKELGELAGKLNSTYVAYGKDRWKAGNQEAQTKNSAGQGAATLAARVA